MDTATYQALRRAARRYVDDVDAAEDLVQDTLVAALEAGRSDGPWLSGVLRNLAALQARGAGRRRRREAVVGMEVSVNAPAPALHQCHGGLETLG